MPDALNAPAELNPRFGGAFLCSRNGIVLAYIYLWPFRPTDHPDLDSEIALDQFRVLSSSSDCSLSSCFSCIRCGRCTNAFRRRSRSTTQPTSFPFVRFKGRIATWPTFGDSNGVGAKESELTKATDRSSRKRNYRF